MMWVGILSTAWLIVVPPLGLMLGKAITQADEKDCLLDLWGVQ